MKKLLAVLLFAFLPAMAAVRDGRVIVSSASKPAFGQNYLITVYEVGAQVASGSASTTISVREGHGFAAGDKLIVNTDTSRYRTVSSTTDTTIEVTSAVSVAQGDLLVNLGTDSGSASPNYDGSGLTVYSDMGLDTALLNSTTQTNSTGAYRYYYGGQAVWELVRSGGGTPVALYQVNAIGDASSIYTSFDGLFTCDVTGTCEMTNPLMNTVPLDTLSSTFSGIRVENTFTNTQSSGANLEGIFAINRYGLSGSGGTTTAPGIALGGYSELRGNSTNTTFGIYGGEFATTVYDTANVGFGFGSLNLCQVESGGTGTFTACNGSSSIARVQSGGTGTIATSRGSYALSQMNGAGTITDAIGVEADVTDTGSGDITSAYGVKVPAITAGAVNNYGIKIGAASGGVGGVNYSLKVDGGFTKLDGAMMLGSCSDTASASPLPADLCNIITITGSANITSINTCNTFGKGRKLTVQCGTATAKIVNGSNLKLGKDYTCFTDGALELMCDGTNWLEVSRKINYAETLSSETLGTGESEFSSAICTVAGTATGGILAEGSSGSGQSALCWGSGGNSDKTIYLPTFTNTVGQSAGVSWAFATTNSYSDISSAAATMPTADGYLRVDPDENDTTAFSETNPAGINKSGTTTGFKDGLVEDIRDGKFKLLSSAPQPWGSEAGSAPAATAAQVPFVVEPRYWDSTDLLNDDGYDGTRDGDSWSCGPNLKTCSSTTTRICALDADCPGAETCNGAYSQEYRTCPSGHTTGGVTRATTGQDKSYWYTGQWNVNSSDSGRLGPGPAIFQVRYPQVDDGDGTQEANEHVNKPIFSVGFGGAAIYMPETDNGYTYSYFTVYRPNDDTNWADNQVNMPYVSINKQGFFADGGAYFGNTLTWPKPDNSGTIYGTTTTNSFNVMVHKDVADADASLLVYGPGNNNTAAENAPMALFLSAVNNGTIQTDLRLSAGNVKEVLGVYENSVLRMASFCNVTGGSCAADLDNSQLIEWEGLTADGSETRLTITEPTADRNVKLPDASGTVGIGSGGANNGSVYWGVKTATSASFDTGTEVCAAAGLACQTTADALGTPIACGTAHTVIDQWLAFCK